MNDGNDKPKNDDWGMTMPHMRLDKEKNEDDFSDDFAPNTKPTPVQSADDSAATAPNFNLLNEQSTALDKTAPNLQIPEDVWEDESPSTIKQPAADDWGMTTPNIDVPQTGRQEDWETNLLPGNSPKQGRENQWSMPKPVFRISEGEKLDDVAKRTVAFNFSEIDSFDKSAPSPKLPENPPSEAFTQTAPNINLQSQPNISEQIPASQVAAEAKPIETPKRSKTPFIIGGLFAMFLFASVFLAGIYFLFFNNPTAMTAKKDAPIRQEQNESVTSAAPALASKADLPKAIEYKGAMVLVSAGEFTMGSDSDADESKPAHQVSLPAFYIDKTEVTNAEYKNFCDASRKTYPPNPHMEKDYFLSRPNAPVVGISFNDAKDYADWAGKRLPTEEEWEKAASWDDATQTKREFPWGNDFQRTNAAFQVPKISDVGKYAAGASSCGALDMAGNVLEWVDAFFQPYPNSPSSNAEFGEKNRVVRGGHFASKSSDSLKTTKRIYIPPTVASGEDDEKLIAAIIGFRCAVSASDSKVQAVLQAQGK